jgi:hypothetical protein
MSFIPVSPIANVLNALLSNNMGRLFILAVASVYTGYTLYPVPKFLDNLFYTSNVFKYLILVLVLGASIFPLDESKTMLVLTVPALVLIFFEMLRQYDSSGSLSGMLGLDCPDKEE